MEFTVVITLAITKDTTFLTLFQILIIYVVKKLVTLIFWGHFLECP